MGRYLSVKTYCGKDPIPQDVTTLPWVGCFSLSAGHKVAGTFSNQKVEVAVDTMGKEVFTVNGTVVTRTHDPLRTNLSYVLVSGGDGYAICPDTGPINPCPSSINVFSRNADKSVLFVVAQCLPPRFKVCVLNRENWDAEISRQPAN
jgi:hypothetical protein